MRMMFIFLGVVSTAVLISEAVGLGVLWSRGQLSSDTLQDIYDMVMLPAEEQQSAVEGGATVAPSMADISMMRVSRILELDSRESELSRIEQFLTEKRNELIQRQDDFEKKQAEFRTELAALTDQITADSTKQARNVLTSISPSDAVDNMMELTLEQNLLLIKGMPKTNVAKIMSEFNKGDDAQKTRGQEIVQALLEGKPDMELATKALNDTESGNPPAESQ